MNLFPVNQRFLLAVVLMITALELVKPGKLDAAAAPGISTQPQSQSVVAGSNAVFTVVASGQGTLLFQWSFNGTNLTNNSHISGATAEALTINTVAAGDAGNYQVAVSNSHGSVTSSNAVLTVLSPPLITTQPTGQSAVISPSYHATAAFSVTASGADPLSYHWRFNGMPLLDQTNSTLTLTNVQLANDGHYTVVITNNYGSVTSSVASLTVWAVLQMPQPFYVGWGGNAFFSVVVTNLHSLPITYQWWFNGTNLLVGQTNSTLLLTNVQPSQEGWYYVRWASTSGSISFSQAPLSVETPPPGTPFILDFNPRTAIPGATVTISGTNFSSTASSNIVYFGAVQAKVVSATTGTLTVSVPVSATYASITVTVNGLTAFSRARFLPTFIGNGSAIGTNTFVARTNLTAGSRPLDVVAADLDGDGKPDLIVANIADHTISLFQNTGSPGHLSFGTRIDLPPIPQDQCCPLNPNYINVADVNGDGKPDIIVCDWVNDQILIYQNVATPGTLTTNSFASAIGFPAGGDPISVRVADMDGDGRPDLIAANWIGTVSIFQNVSVAGNLTTNSFAPRLDFYVGGNPWDVAIADLDGDGKPDLAVANSSTASLSVFHNGCFPGIISFAPRVDFPVLTNCWPIVAADLDGDGRPDLTVGSYNGGVAVLRNLTTTGILSSNSFAPQVVFSSPNRIRSLALGDLNGDGKPDITLVGEISYLMSVYQNLSSAGAFTNTSLGGRVDFAANYICDGIVVADLDGDRRPDVVFCNPDLAGNTISIYQNQSPYGGAPAVIAQPADATIPLAGTLQLSALAAGQAPLAYQWYFDGTNVNDDGVRIGGSTTGSMSISNALLSDSGNYYVVVTNSLGATTSAVANVTVFIVPPSFSKQPQNQTVVVGSNAAFSATITGSQPITLLWFSDNGVLSDDSRISGSTTTALTIAGVQTNDAMNYWLVASNAANVATSEVANLTVLVPPSFIQQPTSQSVIVGSNAIFVAEAEGTSPLSYRWYFNGAPLSDDSRITGSMTSTLGISNVLASDDGNYTVVVSNAAASVTSTDATLTVWVPPSVTIQPIGRSVPLGMSTTFNAVASGSTPAYHWQLNGANIPGATNTSYTISAVGTNDLGIYQCAVSNAAGVTVSSNASLTIGPVAAWGNNSYNQCLPPPGLSNVVSIAGGYSFSLASLSDGSVVAWGGGVPDMNSTFTNVIAVSASANGVLALRADGSVVGSSQLNPLSYNIFPSNIVAVAAGMFHGLALRAEGTVIAWGGGSDPAAAMVPQGLTHVTAISAGYAHSLALRSDGRVVAWGSGLAAKVPIGLSNVVAIAAGNTFSLALKSDGTVVAWGTSPGTNVPPGLSNVVAIAAANSFYAGWGSPSLGFALQSNGRVVAWGNSPYPYLQTIIPRGLSNVVAVAGSYYHTLALVNDGTPLIVGQPVGGTAFSGNPFTLSARVAGRMPLTYSWSRDGTNIAGATNAMFVIPNAQATDIGTYQLTASNDLGVARSIPVPVAVMDSAPFILSSPTNCIVYFGQPLQVESAIAGSGPMQLQWVYDGTNILNATNSDLFIPWGSFSPGTYALVASNAFGSVTSSNVVVTTTGPVIAWGGNQPSDYGAATNVPAGASNAVAIAAGDYDNLALKADGTVIGWGMYGALTNVPPGLSNVIEVAAGSSCSLALKKDGTVTGWGYHIYSDSNAVDTLSNIVSVEADSFGSTFLRADGSLARWTAGSFTYPSSASNIVLLAPLAGGHYAALRADGTIYCDNNSIPPNAGFPALMTNKTVLAFATIQRQSYGGMYLRRDGSVYDWGTPQMPATAGTVLDVACSAFSKLVLRADGSIAASGSDAATNVPFGLTGAAVIDAGYQFGIALLTQHGPPEVFLPDALNTSLLVVSSKGSPRWFGQTNVTHDGTSAAQSAEIGNNTASSMRLWVAGPITASFWWKVSSATHHGILSFSAGGTVLTNISGETGWRSCTVSVPPGNQILQWTYSKDGAAAGGEDAGWVDQLQLIPQAPTILTQPAGQSVVGPANVVLTTAATGTPPLTYRWWKDGSLLSAPNTPSLQLLNAVRTNSGTYWVVVTNVAGSISSSNATLIVRVPQMLEMPMQQPGGGVVLFSTDVGGGLLSASDLTNLEAQVSTNLVDWTVLPNALTLSNGVVQLRDSNTTNSPVRFYRILENW